MKTKTYILYLFLLLPFLSNAQSSFDEYKKRKQEEFNNFKQKKQKEFDNFKKKKQEEFAEFLKNNWIEYEIHSGIKQPLNPDPVDIPKADPNEAITNDELPIIPGKEVLPDNEPAIPNIPAIPDIPDSINYETASFDFLGYPLKIGYDKKIRFSLPDNQEKSVANAWLMLSNASYEELIYKCYLIKEKLQLNDWAYYLFLKGLAAHIFPVERKNEQVVFIAYMLSNSGFKVKMGKDERSEELLLLAPIEEQVYELPFIEISGDLYYTLERSSVGNVLSYNNMDNDEPKKNLQMTIYKPIKAMPAKMEAKPETLMGQKIDIQCNPNAMTLYQQFPICSLSVYFNSECSEEVNNSLQNEIGEKIVGKTPKEQVAIILNFIHGNFPYMKNEEQLGREQCFFYEETLAYPYSDCKDNVALFTYLVRKLTGLKVIGLQYDENEKKKGHAAAAVSFNEDITGNYVVYKGEKYLICDPTYFGARIGQAMPDYADEPAKVIEIRN